jgi:hypothetical protein
LNKSATNISSECKIASIGPDDAMILPHDANPGRIEFSERTTPLKVLYALVFVLLPFAAPAQSLDSSLVAALCHDDYFEDTTGQCITMATHQITIESILEKYGMIITRDTDDEIANFLS